MAIVHIRGFSGWGSWGPGKRCCGGQGKDSVEAAERYGVVGFGADIEKDTSVAWEGSMWAGGLEAERGWVWDKRDVGMRALYRGQRGMSVMCCRFEEKVMSWFRC